MTDKDFLKIIDQAIDQYHGSIEQLQSAIGMLLVGRRTGWKVLYLMHSRQTIKKYETILCVNVREVLPEVGVLAGRSVAWRLAQKVGNFWKAVKGEIPNIRSSEFAK